MNERVTMSTFSSLLVTFGLKSSPIDDYTKCTLSVIEESIKIEKLLKLYIDQQRMFTDSLVEWTASKEPTNKSLTELARTLSRINFEWTKSQEVFRESISQVRQEFEGIATDLGDKEYFESRYESARKELNSHQKKLDKGQSKSSDSETSKLVAKEQRKRWDFQEYQANREHRTMLKAKRSFSGLANGFMHQGASSFNIYQAFRTTLKKLLPDDEFPHTPMVLQVRDYLAINEGRAESSLAIERQISRSRASSIARSDHSVERHQIQRATQSEPILSHAPSLDSIDQHKDAEEQNFRPEPMTIEEVEENRKKKRKKKNRKKVESKIDSAVVKETVEAKNESVEVKDESEKPKSETDVVDKTSSAPKVTHSPVNSSPSPVSTGNKSQDEESKSDTEVRSPLVIPSTPNESPRTPSESISISPAESKTPIEEIKSASN